VTNQHQHQRFEEFAQRFRESALGVAPALKGQYWEALRDLFTRDVTGKGLRELLEHETGETYRFFTRELDFSDLAGQPWYKQPPLVLWRVFLAIAYRLSPWRRILFAIAVPLLLLGWLKFWLAVAAEGPWSPHFFVAWEDWMLYGSTFLFFLLALELRDKLGLKGDLEVARQIQFGLLPFEPYARDGTTIMTAMRPANTVGGDYFDIVELGDGEVSVVVADVAGKGMPAALLMALLQGSLRTLLTAGLRGPEMMSKLNAHLCTNIPSNRLITLFYGEMDTASGKLRYINAGHNPPFLIRAPGNVEHLAATGLALGVMPGSSFEAMSTEIEPGDRLFVYTDGATEAFNTRDEEYGEERLGQYLLSHRDASHRELIEGVTADVLRFCGPVRLKDDMTFMSLGRER
jgi:hypothetical protein